MKYDFLKSVTEGVTESIEFVGDKLKIYIPDEWTVENSKFFEIQGNRASSVGLFWFSVGDEYYELTLPVKIVFEFSEEEELIGKITKDLPEGKYSVFILHNGDKFITDINHVMSVEDMELIFTNMVCEGKIPPTVSYNESIDIMMKLLQASGYGLGLGVSSAVLECLFGEIYRDKNDATIPFRKSVNKSGSTMYDGKMVRLARIPELQSSLSALVGEDMFTSLDALIVRNRKGIKDIESPLEQIMRI